MVSKTALFIWLLLLLCSTYLEIGTIFVLVSILFFIWRSLNRETRPQGLPSAYSVFNTQGERLPGTYSPGLEQILTGAPTNDKVSHNVFYSHVPYTGKKVPRNSSCPCGSTKTYSKCCGNPVLKNLTLENLKERFEEEQ